MIDIDKIKPEIVSCLSPLNPDKIILFGSYAYGTPNEDSDIDLFLVKDGLSDRLSRDFRVNARMKLRNLSRKYHVGFDVVSADSWDFNNRQDHFYKVDIQKNGILLNE